jgi:hypothetical protein
LLIVKLLMRLILAGCLLLQVAVPVWACQHAGDTPCHHCCHDAAPGDTSDDKASACSHCMGQGQTWSVVAVPAGPHIADGRDPWRASRQAGPPLVFPDRFFKPPIVVLPV